MNVKIFAGLVVLNAVVWAVVLLGGEDVDTSGDLVLPGVDISEIQAFSVSKPGSKAVVRRSPPGIVEDAVLYDSSRFGFWELLNPSGAPVAAEVIAGIFGQLEQLTYESKEEVSDRTLKEQGLTPPRLTIEYATKNLQGVETKFFDIGEKSSFSGLRYVRKREEPNTVYAVSADLSQLLEIDLEDVRERYPFRVNAPFLTAIKIENKNTTRPWVINFVKDKGWFVSVRNGVFPVDLETIAGLVQRVYNLKVKRFVDEFDGGLKQFGLTKPSASVTFETDLTSNTVYFGINPDETGRFAKINTSEWVYEIEGSWPSVFNGTPSDVISKSPYSRIRLEDIDTFIIARNTEGEGESRGWIRKGSGWQTFYEEVASSVLLDRIRNELDDGEIKTESVFNLGSEEDIKVLATILGGVSFVDYAFDDRSKLQVAPHIWEILFRERGNWWALAATSITVDDDVGEITEDTLIYGTATLYGGLLTTPVVLRAGEAAALIEVVNKKIK